MAIASKRLEARAREFASDLNDLLNGTVTSGVRLSSVLHFPDLVICGLGVTKTSFKPGVIRLTTGAKAPTAFLRVGYALVLDREGQYLTVAKSDMAVYADPGGRDALVHYDYNIDPPNEYPSAHVQVVGTSTALEAIRARAPEATGELGRLHFPVGGRRFRPTLEDVLEFLVVEKLAIPHTGWSEVIARHRETWREAQTKATVRRYPAWACAALEALGYTVKAPHPKS